jgi:replicative DNA helicase
MNNPPNNENMEKACLSCALLNPSVLKELKENLTPEDFYYHKHQVFFKCLAELPGIIPDFISMRTWYEENKLELKHIDYVELFESSASSANVQYYITELKKLSNSRKLLTLSQKAIENIYKSGAEDAVEELLRGVKQIGKDDSVKVYSSEDLFKDKKVDDFRFNKDEYIKTGINDFDENFFGLCRSEFVIIAGRPTQGKSVLAMNISMNHSFVEPVLYFSLEMPEKFFKIRMLACEAQVNSMKIQHWKLSEIEREKTQDAINKLAQRKMFVVDRSGLKKETIENKTKQVFEKHGLGLIVVDYLQIMSSASKENRYIRIGEDSLALKNLGRELNIPVIAISSMGRGVNTDLLSSFRESGNIEYDADKAMFIEYDNWEGSISEDHVQGKIVLVKNKNGATGHAPITFYKQYSKII